MELWETCPPLSEADVAARVAALDVHEEFLFYRVNQGDDLDWVLGAPEDGYEMFCTACGQRFFEPRDRKRPAKQYERCPQCGMPVSPKRWRDRARLEAVQFAFHLFQRGEGSEVWFRSYQVTMNRDFENADKYDIFEYCRILFHEGGARKWTRSRSWYSGVSDWKPVKQLCLKRWHGAYGTTRDDVWDDVTEEEMRGSCLQYAPVGEAKAMLDDIIPFLALWCRYPAAEYVWKLGFAKWFADRARGQGKAFAQVVNLRATRPDRLFPQLDKGEVKLLRRGAAGGWMDCDAVWLYQRLKKAGAVQPSAAGMAFARDADRWHGDFFGLAERCGAEPKTLRRYLQQQAGRRGGVRVQDVMQELHDYLGQLERLEVRGGDRMPRDLHAAHARLSERERKLKNGPLNSKFRARRRLLRWMCWRHDGLLIRPVDSAEEIVREGEQQHNCVAGYAARHAEGKTVILLLRRCSAPGESWHTVEIDPETMGCRQCYAAHNRQAEPEAEAFIAAYLEHLQQVRPRKREKGRRAA